MLAHITFSISYVTIVVRARIAAISQEVEEAAMDLGAHTLAVGSPDADPGPLALRGGGRPAGLRVLLRRLRALVLHDRRGRPTAPGADLVGDPVRLDPTINAIGTLMMVVSLSAIGLAVILPRLFGKRESGLKVLTAGEG